VVRRLQFAFLIGALSLTGAALTGCGGTGCLGNEVPALRVTVWDGPGGPEVCSATVTATDGAYTTALTMSWPGATPCRYGGPSERPGVYTIEAAFEGRTATAPDVRVDSNECHVNTREIEMVLPAGAAAETPAQP
jgi:hypothetical protein